MNWALVYTDRSVYTSEDGPPEAAPRTGVQVVLCAHPDYGYVIEESPFGAWTWQDDEGCWFGVDEAGLWAYRLTYPGRPLVLYGERLTDARWGEIRCWADENIGQKSAWRPLEVRRDLA